MSDQFRGAVITEDYEKMRCIIDDLVENIQMIFRTILCGKIQIIR